MMKTFLPLQDDKEKKRIELLERKKENQRLLDEETARIKGKALKEASAGGKVTRAQIDEMLHNNEQQQQQQLKPKGKAENGVQAALKSKPSFHVMFGMSYFREEPPGDSTGGECEQNYP